mmetsp:Transcript_5629/g.7341  ORF Transcript_5629/g.7341 Transcript_5629/m.7341 type:complete len:380 (-) Transcript_5629:1101-2240(-)|eukprot:CAMPEP_0204873624 /NCGR_PEP_ID=MMETSP1348-20121228/41135_1 /ASSEMBLY_ACC=CAM_ASM_000700 /TAXON_ID=215587 /ORGANISM="Aplanochytrium stocchinoi, Strain GSBS06" /LENGTH=379 /DNA_ID=CAMNT_0052029059 /DNA_START=211 /DNA_END=1350 /DNA_ORIENTATION=+
MGANQTKEGQTSKQIDKELAKFHKLWEGKIKLLLLGAGESGKSTLFKQMKILYSEQQDFTQEERQYYRGIVHSNIINDLQILVKAASKHMNEVDAEDAANELLGWSANDLLLNDKAIGTIEALWNDKSIMKMWEDRANVHVQDSLEYYMNNVKRISKGEAYVPTNDDILRSRVQTTEVTSMTFKIKKTDVDMYDVGGQRSFRHKWMHHFNNVTAVIFVAGISEYNQNLVEDSGMNRQDESIQLFRKQLESPHFKNIPIILFLNKKDLFREKLAKYAFKIVSGPEARNVTYEGPECITDKDPPYSTLGDDEEFEACYDGACTYLQEIYCDQQRDLDVARTAEIYCHLTNSTSSENIRFIMTSCTDILLKHALSVNGFYRD